MIHEFISGRSGSQVTLIDYNGMPAVKKTNVRNVEKVVQLQTNFAFARPHVYEWRDNCFVQEYIPGIPVRKLLYSADRKQLDLIVNTLKSYIRHCLDNSVMYDYSAEIAAKELSTGYGARITDPHFPKYNIHGDLTIDNLLFYQDQIYFIDFNWTDLDSVYFDVNKLRQDLDGLWFARHNEPNLTLQMNVSYIRRHLDCAFPQMFRDDLYRFQLSRILPYIKGEEYDFVMREIKRCE